jgi:hypothetical protein
MTWRPIGLWDVKAPTFYRKSAHRWRWGSQPYAPDALYFPERFLVLISVRGWVDPRDMVWLEGIGQLRNPMTSSWIEPATFRLVAEYLNQLYNRVPPTVYKVYVRIDEHRTWDFRQMVDESIASHSPHLHSSFPSGKESFKRLETKSGLSDQVIWLERAWILEVLERIAGRTPTVLRIIMVLQNPTRQIEGQKLYLNYVRTASFYDRLCGLVVRGPGFDSKRYQIFWEIVGLERGPLSLVRIIEELLEWKSRGSGTLLQI